MTTGAPLTRNMVIGPLLEKEAKALIRLSTAAFLVLLATRYKARDRHSSVGPPGLLSTWSRFHLRRVYRFHAKIHRCYL